MSGTSEPTTALHLTRWTVTSGSNSQSRGAVVLAAGERHWRASAQGNDARLSQRGIKHLNDDITLDPRYGLGYLFGHGFTGFLVLGGVFLCATGAEALYADMGHFGPRTIRLTWYGLVLPTLVLNYAGQTAVLVENGGTAGSNPFFAL